MEADLEHSHRLSNAQVEHSVGHSLVLQTLRTLTLRVPLLCDTYHFGVLY